jgi:hypothetical protein
MILPYRTLGGVRVRFTFHSDKRLTKQQLDSLKNKNGYAVIRQVEDRIVSKGRLKKQYLIYARKSLPKN